jgi:hypothetical protein
VKGEWVRVSKFMIEGEVMRWLFFVGVVGFVHFFLLYLGWDNKCRC